MIFYVGNISGGRKSQSLLSPPITDERGQQRTCRLPRERISGRSHQCTIASSAQGRGDVNVPSIVRCFGLAFGFPQFPVAALEAEAPIPSRTPPSFDIYSNGRFGKASRSGTPEAVECSSELLYCTSTTVVRSFRNHVTSVSQVNASTPERRRSRARCECATRVSGPVGRVGRTRLLAVGLYVLVVHQTS
jgi:hypothetical protein